MFILILAMSFGIGSASACMGVDGEIFTFLKELNSVTRTQPVVARVTIVTDDKMGLARVRVIEAMRGVKKGEMFPVVYETHSCARDEISPGQEYFVSGSRDKVGRFRGVWKHADMEKP